MAQTPRCVCGHCQRCWGRAAQARYRQTDKGKAANRRYRVTAKGKLNDQKFNARRIHFGGQHRGYAPTGDVANLIRQHIKERTRAFIERFETRAQAESPSAGAISTQAEPRTD